MVERPDATSTKQKSLTTLLGYALSNWRGWAFIFVMTLLSSVFGLLGPWPMKVLVDNVLGTQPLPEPLSSWWPGESNSPRATTPPSASAA
jgi:hypothetical protein